MQEILKKANAADFEFLVGVLDSYVNLSADSKLKELLGQLQADPKSQGQADFAALLEKEIRYAGSADLAYFCRWLFATEPGASTDEIVQDVASKLGVKIRILGTAEAKLERLIKAVVEKQFFDLSSDQQQELLGRLGVGGGAINELLERLRQHGKRAALPMLLQTLGRPAVEKIVATLGMEIIAKVMGREAAKQLIKHMATKFPWWSEWLGPVAWGATAAWLALDLQGPAYRKTVPAVLYLGLISLRDGADDDGFWTEDN